MGIDFKVLAKNFADDLRCVESKMDLVEVDLFDATSQPYSHPRAR